jgi:hypothetical protein
MVTVLYLAGSGRSGSTLLARILGQATGVFTAGEVRYVWQRGLVENRLCGCGTPFRDCPFWTDVFTDAFGGFDGVDAKSMMTVQRGLTRLRHVPRLIATRRSPADPDYLDRLGRLYTAAAVVSGSSVVVDSSKLPSYGFVLSAVPSLDVRTVHLVRDPRGTAFSWTKTKAQPDRGGDMQRMSVLKSSALWLAWNATAPALFGGRSKRLRYEDLVAAPRPVVDDILAFAGHEGEGSTFVGERTVSLQRSHTVAGNPNRLEAGPVELRADQSWTTELGRPQRLLATAVTVPLLGRFDYPLTVKPARLRDLTVRP